MAFILPDPLRKKRLQGIQKKLAEFKEDGNGASLGAAVKLMLEEPGFQTRIAQSPPLAKPVNGPAELMDLAWAFLYHLLNAKDFVAAAMTLWDSETFTAEPACVREVWNALMTKRMIVIIGGGGLGKTYSPSAYFLLEYIRDPEWTRVQLASASEDHLLGNLFADIGRLHSDASMKLPGRHDAGSISLDKKRAQGIFTLTLPGGTTGKSKIKGTHTKPRPMHPQFGRRSRVFALIDEGQEIAQNAFEEIANRFSTVAGDDIEHLKFVITANPRLIFSPFGKITKPIRGWESIDRTTVTWESQRGWTVISLDQTQHENYKARRVVFPGFATYEGVQIRLRDCDGDENDPRMWTFCYGKFPTQGTTFAVIKQRHLLAAEGEWIFSDNVLSIAGVDPAFTSDRPTMAMGRVGRAIGWTDGAGEKHTLEKPKMAIQIDAVAVLPKGDSQDLADECLTRLKDLNVRPECFGIDQTGIGRGTADIIRRQWAQKVGPINGTIDAVSAAIHGIEFGGAATGVKIAEEDTLAPKDRFDRIATEIWYAAAKLFEFDSIRIGSSVDVKVLAELAARKGDMQAGLGKKLTVETKDAYKLRTGGDSPDMADATLIMIHAARMSIAGIVPRAKDTAPVKEDPRVPVWAGWGQSLGGVDMQGFAGAGTTVDFMKD